MAQWVKNPLQWRRGRRHRFNPWVRKVPWRKAWQPLQYSCLKDPMDRGPWRATVRRVAELDRTEHAHTHTFIVHTVKHETEKYYILLSMYS